MPRRVARVAALAASAAALHAAPSPPLTWAQLAALTPPPPDRVVSYGPAPQQTIALRLPRVGEPHPAVLLIHGGCWLNEFDRAYFEHLADALRQRGWATFNLEYRRLGDDGGGWPGSFMDVRVAWKFVSAHAAEWHIDAKQLFVAGHSAGGHLALLLAAQEPDVLGVIGLAAITDLTRYQRESHACGSAALRLVGTPPPAVADPMQQLLPRARVILLSGSVDRIVPLRYGDAYAARDKRITHRILAGAGHFDLVAPVSAHWPAVLQAFTDLRTSE